MKKQPRLNFWQIWNVSFGFLGIQMGFALQGANVSRVLSSLGADLHHLSLFWLAAPVMGLIVQPIVGGASDRTWNRFGRRGPYILGGAIIAALAMFFMPNAGIAVKIMPPLVFGAVMFALMDGSFNITMQPFRALVADMTPEEQRNTGYSIQSFLINTGAVLGSILPFVLTNVLGVSNVDPDGGVPSSVIWSFYIGGGMLLLSVLWTVFRTKEYPPEEYAEYKGLEVVSKEKKEKASLAGFLKLLKETPKTMMQLAVVQFFSWFALYLMWVYTTYALAQHSWGCSIDDVSSKSFQDAGDWVGILFGGYSLFAAIFSVVMSNLANRFGRKNVYAISLLLGGIGYLSTYLFSGGEIIHLNLLITQVDVPSSASLWLFSMVGVGIAWAAILAMPYSILSDSLPADKMGVYMGIFNFTIAGPQIISGIIAGEILRYFFDGEAIYIMIIAGVSMLLGAISVAFVKQNKAVKL
ncbi:MFS transporter [Ancylomarina euxinus]|uniref:MFS transporter n=1 Tax=Ancylomarina euxinus TaxID=2283627 RepID=A0A425XXP7_9BACT|nr:MFS transporter [Ancylomarina euxinus]MCZ4694744.1 MFS transporter [Ancylomarina euxinus]MUP16408.1 MFS transporter [Ancylomarina euxinus]RRG19449.1 MFS transporter [Ancylomarina euxinus]